MHLLRIVAAAGLAWGASAQSSASESASATAINLGPTITGSSSNPLSTADCGALRLIVARGSGEAPGTGYMGWVALNITAKIPGAVIEGLDYPANFTGYLDSEPQGVTALTNRITSFAETCPKGKLVLLGYSQVSAFVLISPRRLQRPP